MSATAPDPGESGLAWFFGKVIDSDVKAKLMLEVAKKATARQLELLEQFEREKKERLGE